MTTFPSPWYWFVVVSFGFAVAACAVLGFVLFWDWLFGVPPEDRFDR